MNYTTESLNEMNAFKCGDILYDSKYGTDCHYFIVEDPSYPYVKLLDTGGHSITVSYTYLVNTPSVTIVGRLDLKRLSEKINDTIAGEISLAIGGSSK